jgi:predicted transposase YdaD
MEFVPIWEKDILEEGIKKGIREGRIEGRIQGKREGRLEGRIQGIREGKLEAARELLKNGVDIDIIASATGIPKKEIEEPARQAKT